MKNLFLVILTLINLTAFAQGQVYSWVGIDCGADTNSLTNGWQTDEAFIKTGTNHPAPNNNIPLPVLNTLRAFTTQNKNCYTLAATPTTRYFVRATFYYGNYDGMSSPPTFDLQIDGNLWMTVVSDPTGVVYYEILYTSQAQSISVCLARIQDDHFPFISSLESWPILVNMYTGMSQELAWVSSYRYRYGTDDWILGYPGDNPYNRIWKPMTEPGTVNISGDPTTPINSYCAENPPVSALLDAIETKSETTSLFLSFSLAKAIPTVYIETYFTEMSVLNSTHRIFDMYVGGQLQTTVRPLYWVCTCIPVLIKQVAGNNLTIELRPDASSALPPIISAIEVYTAIDPLVTIGTSQDDCTALDAFTGMFVQLQGWSGEPCLPADTAWQWLSCTGTNPPRVTSLNLSGYDLSGNLPYFGQMHALVSIDLSNNSLTGRIPEFLGNLPNLRTLNLSHNHFSGTLPSNIRNNPRLIYLIDGNPDVDASGKHKISTALIIGIAVGVPLVLIFLLLALAYWLIRKRAYQVQNQVTGTTESGNSTEPNNLHISPLPSAPTEPTVLEGEEEEEDDDCIPVTSYIMEPHHQTMVPEMDLEELEGLIDQYNETHANHQVELTSEHDGVLVIGHIVDGSDDQDMIPDMDLEELDELIKHENERARELATHN